MCGVVCEQTVSLSVLVSKCVSLGQLVFNYIYISWWVWEGVCMCV